VKKSGFSILEIVIAGAILLISVAVVFSILPNIYKLNRKAWNLSKATYLAQEKLDELIEQNVYIDTTPHSDHPKDLENCVRSWWGEEDPYGNPEVQVIKVKVEWTERYSKRHIEVQGLVAP